MHILLAGFQHETNTFAPDPADLAAFEHGGGFPGLCRAEAVRDAMAEGVNLPAAGFLAEAARRGAQVTPILWAAACPSGPVCKTTYETLADEIVSGIARACAGDVPVDGIYLDLHGAMVAEHLPDGEGALIGRVRALVGPDMPLVVSLDLHGNITEDMIAGADALVAFRTYPHVDMAETGARALALLARRIETGRPFAVACARLPFMIPICWQSTMTAPADGLYQALAEIEAASGVHSLSWCMGFPAADVEGCGQMVWAHADTHEAAQQAVDTLVARITAAEADFAGPLHSPKEAVVLALAANAEGRRPVVIADAQDNPGAGGSSDTTGLLAALIAAGAPDAALGILYDPQAAEAAHRAGPGAEITLDLGGRAPVPGVAPLPVRCTVEALSDGHLRTRGPYYGAGPMALGPAACLRIGGVRVLVASRKAQMADREMFRFLGVEPETTDILVVKSAIHFRADFAPIAGRILTAIAPGAMMMRATDWAWANLRPGLRLMPGGPSQAECLARRA